MRKIRERKEEFKTVWGVSPININTRRTVLVKKKTESPAVLPETIEEPDRRVRFNSGGNQTRAFTPTDFDTPISSLNKQPIIVVVSSLSGFRSFHPSRKAS